MIVKDTQHAVDGRRGKTRRRLPREPLSSHVKDVGKRVVGWSSAGLSRLLGGRSQPAGGVLCYHRIARHVPGLPSPTMNVEPARFRQQLTGLIDRGFVPLRLGELLRRRQAGNALPDRAFVVTFDDAFESVYTQAWPILRELQIPAAVFLSTAFIDSEEPFPCDPWGIACCGQAAAETWRPLRARQCVEMVESGLVELGAHTHTHQNFSGRPDDFAADLQTSVDILRKRFALDGVTFAFPYGCPYDGTAGPDLLEAARRCGVQCALTTRAAPVDFRSDPLGWGRFVVTPWDTGATLSAKLEGWYSWAPRLLHRVMQRFQGRPAAAAGEERSASTAGRHDSRSRSSEQAAQPRGTAVNT